MICVTLKPRYFRYTLFNGCSYDMVWSCGCIVTSDISCIRGIVILCSPIVMVYVRIVTRQVKKISSSISAESYSSLLTNDII